MTTFGRGISTATGTAAATNQALDSARDQLGSGVTPSLAVALSDPEYDAGTIVDTIQDTVGDVPILGATTAGEFTDQETTDGGLVIALIGTDGLAVSTALAEGVSEDVFGTVQHAVDGLPDQDELGGDYAAAITFHNGLAGKGEQITLVTNQLLGDIPLAGGSAGDALALEETTVYTERDMSSDGVAIALLGGETPFGLAANHGHVPVSETFEVTAAEENVIHEIDGKPAFEVWKREIADVAAEEYDIDVESVSDDELAELLTKFELGIPTGEDTHKIRWPGLTDSTDGRLTFATGVPEGSEVQIMHSPKAGQVESAGDAARDALTDLGADDAAGALVFDCVCRELILGEEFDEAVAEIATEIEAPLAGFETYGEICMHPDETSGYHNTTTSILLLS